MLKDENNIQLDKLTDESLKTPPQFSLSNDFAGSVAFKAARRFMWEQYFGEFLVYFGVVFGILAITGGVAFFWLEASWAEWLNLITANVWLVGGISFTLLFILFADKVLLRYFYYRYSNNKITG